jgi:hypothetical protein
VWSVGGFKPTTRCAFAYVKLIHALQADTSHRPPAREPGLVEVLRQLSRFARPGLANHNQASRPFDRIDQLCLVSCDWKWWHLREPRAGLCAALQWFRGKCGNLGDVQWSLDVLADVVVKLVDS